MDRVVVADLRVNCIVGVRPHEREVAQDVLISVEVATDVSHAARTEQLGDTIDYSALSRQIRDVAVGGRFQLIETMAERVAALVLAAASTASVDVTIKKPAAIADGRHAAVKITRARPAPDRPQIVGVVNLSPESRVPDSVATGVEAVVAKATDLRDQGADFIELGGRSISHDQPLVDAAAERERLAAPLAELRKAGFAVAVDTWSLETADWALRAGVRLLNFTGRSASEELLQLAASREALLSVLYLPYADPYVMRDAQPARYGTQQLLAWGGQQQSRARAAGLRGLLLDPNAGIFHPSLDEAEKVNCQVQAISALTDLHARGATTLVYLGRKRELVGRLLLGALIARQPIDYIRTHEPQLARRMLEAAARSRA
jgi:dihydroneopterin aldolase